MKIWWIRLDSSRRLKAIVNSTYHLTSSGRTTRQNLPGIPNLSCLLVGEVAADQVVNGQFDGLLGSDTDQLGQDTRVETQEALIADDLPRAVDGIVVQPLTDTGATLVLHSRFHQVNGVDHESTKGSSNATERKVVDRLQDIVEDGFRLFDRFASGRGDSSFTQGQRGVPGRIDDLGEILERESSRGCIQTSEMEQNIGLHRCKERKAGDAGRLVQEISPRDLAIITFARRLAQNEINEIHLTDNILERAHVGVGDLAAGRDVAERREVLQQVVGELVPGGAQDDALEIFRLNVAITVLVEVMEGLADTLALQSTQHLCELGVCHVMTGLLPADIERRPFRVPVEGDAIRSFVEIVQFLEGLVLDRTGALDVEQAEGNLVLRIGLAEQVLEGGPVRDVYPARLSSIGDGEENAVLLALDFMLPWTENNRVSFQPMTHSIAQHQGQRLQPLT